MLAPEFDNKRLTKAGGHNDQNVVNMNNKDEDNNPKILDDKKHMNDVKASAQKFR